MKKQTTHIKKIRTLYASNQQYIRAAFGWDEDNYNNQWIDLGRAFLESHYPKKDAQYASCHKRIAADRQFWCWWLAEWKLKEAYCLHAFKQHHRQLTKSDYQKIMSCLVDDDHVETSFFNNYLYPSKSIHNASNPNQQQTNKRPQNRRKTPSTIQNP